MLHAEALLLVDNDQAQVGEADVLAQQPVRADDDVDLPLLRGRDDFFLLAGRAESRQAADRKRILRHPFAERLVMLFRQHRGRHEHRHLPAILDHLERRPHGQFRLAVADVATQQPVHRARLAQVGLDLARDHELIFRLLEQE